MGRESPQTTVWRCSKALVFCTVLVVLLVLGIVNHRVICLELGLLLKRSERLGWFAPILLMMITAILNLLMLPSFPLMVAAGVQFTNMYGLTSGIVIGIGA